ncbi:MAG: ABC transporter ATP-binding protein [Beijerinckiaceae bacterium]|mgnify:CR=1 FL=1|nr:ABC transporter ATP-binding protein [Beijerinckiaceae bacterium]
MTSSDAPLLDVRALQIRYGAVNAVRDASLTVRKGELVAVIGNNGAGKSSILRGICGLVKPVAGKVIFSGLESTSMPAHQHVARGLVMVPEGRLIFADQSVEDNLILGAYTRWRKARPESLAAIERAYTLFPRLKERRHQQAGSLSGGEQQMLAIARGLNSNPKLLMIDELSLGLAPKIVEQLLEVLQTLNRQGLSILLVEQLAAYALGIAQRAYVVANGVIAKEGKATELANDPEVMAAFLGKKHE